MPPNVVVFLTDDHAQWAAGTYGNTEIRTPTLDHLAHTGVRMANSFTPTPVCSPARASFWTGKLPSQHGLHDYLAEADPEVASIPWLKGETILAERLQDAGYQTALCGKWHLGSPERRPRSFDYWYALSGPSHPPSCFETPWTAPISCDAYNKHSITDHAVDFIRRAGRDRPFFLFVGYFATHSPWLGHAERLVAQYRNATFADIPPDLTHPFGRLASEAVYATRHHPREALAQYYAAVSEIDEQVGRVLDELEDQGLREDTLIVYTADHGLNTGHHGLWGKGNATHPYNMLEESIRIPMIINHPQLVLGGQTRAEFVSQCDLHATLLDLAGVPDRDGPPGQPSTTPGRSFADLLRGKSIPEWPDRVFGEYGDLRMVRTHVHKLIRRHGRGSDELFDLATDPRETINVIDDPAHQAVAQELADQLDRYFANYETDKSGLRVLDLPRHNGDEAWRYEGPHRLVEEPSWLATLAPQTGRGGHQDPWVD